MIGNAAEFVADRLFDSYEGAPMTHEPWGSLTLYGGARVNRGGSFEISCLDPEREQHCSGLAVFDRNGMNEDTRVPYVGFRVARDL